VKKWSLEVAAAHEFDQSTAFRRDDLLNLTEAHKEDIIRKATSRGTDNDTSKASERLALLALLTPACADSPYPSRIVTVPLADSSVCHDCLHLFAMAAAASNTPFACLNLFRRAASTVARI
jgi:hypothetical protein